MKETHTGAAPAERLAHIDALKTLAMCMVLVYHCTLYSIALGLDSEPIVFVRMYFRGWLSACVPLFFAVNGYLLMGSQLNLKKHTIRLLRMICILVFWRLFLLLVLQPLRGEYFTWEETRQRFWSLQIDWNNHLWYLESLIGVYIFYPLIKQCYDGNRKVFLYFAALCGILVFGNPLINQFLTVFNRVVRNETIVHIAFPFFGAIHPFAGNVGMGLAYFCLGGILRDVQERIGAVPRRNRNILAGLGFLVSGGLLLFLAYGYSILSKKTWDIVWYGYTTVFTLFNVVCLFVLSLNVRRTGPLVRAISGNTLGIYLMHIIAQEIVGRWFAGVPAFQTFWASCLYAAVVLVLCLAVCLPLKKIPVLKKLI